MSTEPRDRLQQNVLGVRDRIAAAAQRSGRVAGAVQLIAVTKYVETSVIRELIACGCEDLGESRPQSLWKKVEELRSAPLEQTVRWHLIGHLQGNKVARTLPLVSLIHSGDSMKLLQELQLQAARIQRRVAILLEVNISGDASKHGFYPTQLEEVLEVSRSWPHLEIQGLMGMSGLASDPTEIRREFRSLRQLYDDLNGRGVPDPVWTRLSMGMSDDFEIAIEEGATCVRVGSALFEGLG